MTFKNRHKGSKNITKKGDTLIEVALALGIFSLVAIAVVSVVSAATSNAQSSLENTVAREEIDVQAEALRFIHESYLTGGQNYTSNPGYFSLWKAITDQAITKSDPDAADALSSTAATCRELYDFDSSGHSLIQKQRAFIINPRSIDRIARAGKDVSAINNAIAAIVIRPGYNGTGSGLSSYRSNDNGNFYTAATYPRILYRNEKTAAVGTADDTLNAQNNLDSGYAVNRVEGLYVVAVKDPESAVITDSGSSAKKSAYYDFYIRTCWFGPGADRPTTISTVVRLYDPSIIEY